MIRWTRRVWNPKRILFLDDNPGKILPRAPNASSLINHVVRLETDRSFRESFFAEPILAPTARKWLKQWCHESSSVLRAGLERAGKL